MTINMTGLDNVTSLQGLAFYTNNAVDGVLFTGGLIVLYLVMLMFLSRRGEDFANVLAVSSWSFFLVSGFFWLAHLITTLLPLLFLFLAGFSTLYIYASKR